MTRIALVDDSKLARTFAKWAIAPTGIDFQEIDPVSLEEVLGALKGAPPDLLLLDVLMPSCPGKDLLEAIRKDDQLAGLPVLLVTAMGDGEVIQPFVALGISGYIHKPVNPESLIKQVKETLGV